MEPIPTRQIQSPNLKNSKLFLTQTLDAYPISIPSPLGKVCYLKLDDKDPFCGRTLRKEILSRVSEGKWFILAAAVDESSNIYFANGWNFTQECLMDSNSSFIPGHTIIDYALFRTKIVKDKTTGENQLSFKFLCTKKEFESKNNYFRSYVAALDESLEPDDRGGHCIIVSEAKANLLNNLDTSKAPGSKYRWLERAVELDNAMAAISLGSEIMRSVPQTNFTLANKSVISAKKYFDRAQAILMGRVLTMSGLDWEDIEEDEPYDQIVQILKDFDENDPTREEALLLVHNLELFYQCLTTVDSSTDLERVEFYAGLSRWFQFEESTKRFEEIMLDRAGHVSELDDAKLMAMILYQDLYLELLEPNLLYAAKKAYDSILRILNNGVDHPTQKKFDGLLEILTTNVRRNEDWDTYKFVVDGLAGLYLDLNDLNGADITEMGIFLEKFKGFLESEILEMYTELLSPHADQDANLADLENDGDEEITPLNRLRTTLEQDRQKTNNDLANIFVQSIMSNLPPSKEILPETKNIPSDSHSRVSSARSISRKKVKKRIKSHHISEDSLLTRDVTQGTWNNASPFGSVRSV